jgi:hypothetical protein
MDRPFQLFLFSTNPALIREAVAAGIAGVVIDWERAGKLDRQLHANTEINQQTVDDLHAARAATEARILCRINPFGGTSEREIEDAVAAGADEILLPMVRSVEEVAATLRLARDRCGVGILVETVSAVQCAQALGRLPLSRVYVGLNDLMIDRGHSNIFTALLDGTVERVRSAFSVPFGVAGLTLVQQGSPVPCRLLIAEMARLDCQFTFLRRSFHRDRVGHRLGREIPLILQALAAAGQRRPDDVAWDRRALDETLQRVLFERTAGLKIS